MPESTMEGFRNNHFDKTKAYVPQEEEGTAFVSQQCDLLPLPFANGIPQV